MENKVEFIDIEDEERAVIISFPETFQCNETLTSLDIQEEYCSEENIPLPKEECVDGKETDSSEESTESIEENNGICLGILLRTARKIGELSMRISRYNC